MGRESLVPKTVIRSDGKTSTYWVRPDHKAKVGMGIAAAIMIPVSALALSGCATGAGNDTTPSPLNTSGNSNTESPRPSETAAPVAIAGDTNNDGKLSAFEKQVLDSHAAKDYTMPDGSVVKIDPTQPLPAPVVAAVQANARPVAAALTSASGRASIDAYNSLAKNIQEQSLATGKGLMFVYKAINVDANNIETIVWAATPSNLSSTNVQPSKSMNEVVASATTWGNSRGYEVIVIQ